MSLYDDIEIKKSTNTTATSFSLLQSQLAARKAASKPSLQRKPITNVNAQKANVRYNLHTGVVESVLPPFIGAELSTTGSLLGSLNEEYNPLQPNEYEAFKKFMIKNKLENNKKKKLSDSEIDEEEEEERKRKLVKKSFIAPPKNLIEQDKQILNNDPVTPKDAKLIAEKIMTKMGWNAGQGLGKSKQGMSRALEVEKTSRKGGRIIHEKDLPPSPPEFEMEEEIQQQIYVQPNDKPPIENINELLKNPSKVVVLCNMVGPGEVDDDLEPETKEECQKYGPVVRCVIFEIPDEIPEKAVRIFVEFERVESATKAVIDLHGRFFGGRIVKAYFYDSEKFERLQLTEPLGL